MGTGAYERAPDVDDFQLGRQVLSLLSWHMDRQILCPIRGNRMTRFGRIRIVVVVVVDSHIHSAYCPCN